MENCFSDRFMSGRVTSQCLLAKAVKRVCRFLRGAPVLNCWRWSSRPRTADKIGIERKRIADYSALNPCWPVETGGAEAASLRMTGRSHTIAPDRSFFCAGQCRKRHYSGGGAIFYV